MWEVGKEYKTRRGEIARFVGILDTPNEFQTHIFAVRTAAIPPVEQVRVFSADGKYVNNSAQYRTYDVISDQPTAAERRAIERVQEVAGTDKLTEVLLEIMREGPQAA